MSDNIYDKENDKLIQFAGSVDMSNYSNPNLLDNPWFTINQRGATSYSGAGYTFDRWATFLSGFSVSKTNNVVTLTNNATETSSLLQYLDIDTSNIKTYTISVMLSDGTVKTRTITKGSSENYVLLDGGDVWATCDLSVARPYFNVNMIAGKSISIKSVKLEKGTVSTLANDVAPNYAEELAKCQRYYQKIVNAPNSILACRTTNTDIVFGYPLSVPMRATPTFTCEDVTKIEVYTPTGAVAPKTSDTITVDGSYKTNQIMLGAKIVFADRTFTAGLCGSVRFNTTIELSADL